MEPLSILSQSRQLGDLMVDFSEDESLPAIGPSRLDLFMTVIRVASWPTTVRWYIDTLGLPPIVMDAQHEFALLSAGSGRLGVQGTKEARFVAGPGKVRLVFQVRDLEGERQRLIGQGVVVGDLIENLDEGYREVRLQDPEGHSLRLFAWVDPTRGDPFTRRTH
jgi:catechol 2,3-dioxygenase-like lactoylglutathione lyase family enzyme